ncbi:FtsB family cell division protein [Lactobacillus corticis]|uniref:Septum formation initiation protein n=1 Tax=Lactobacillus corticis TaxID=2201249 RepID=A0A916QGF2_9LACO|nr:septum formation initiator family protein [Lactobacillus corticis]GFZ26831.1 septum formation initiation protein [Lactobacillus corticis]
MTGPRIYNSESPDVIQARLEQKEKKRAKNIHRKRRRRLLTVFLVPIALLSLALYRENQSVKALNSEVKTYKSNLKELKTKRSNLTDKRSDLQDTDYVAKLIRYKYYYSKPGEKIYHIPETGN